jgi:hypothetical protein
LRQGPRSKRLCSCLVNKNGARLLLENIFISALNQKRQAARRTHRYARFYRNAILIFITSSGLIRITKFASRWNLRAFAALNKCRNKNAWQRKPHAAFGERAEGKGV